MTMLPQGHQGMIRKIKDYAAEHYEQDGWDLVIECWSDEDLSTVISECGDDYEKAFGVIHDTVKTIDDRRRDAEGEVF